MTLIQTPVRSRTFNTGDMKFIEEDWHNYDNIRMYNPLERIKKILFSFFLLLTVIVYANEGKAVFEKKCASCHQGFVPLLDLHKNFFEMNNTLLKLTAPTVNQLSFRLKQRIGDPKGDEDMHRMEVGAFIADYVQNPNINKSVCQDEVMQYFKEMPSMDGQIDDEELEEVSNYIYDFEAETIKILGTHDENNKSKKGI